MKLNIHRKPSTNNIYEYRYIVAGAYSDIKYFSEIYDNYLEINDFEDFAYWFEQQIYYIAPEQFKKIDGIWLRMMVECYKTREELPF
jgi:hypothetical protein